MLFRSKKDHLTSICPFKGKCRDYREEGHIARDCQQRQGCASCGDSDHYRLHCPARSLSESQPVCESLSVLENDRSSIDSNDSDILSENVINEALEVVSEELSAPFGDDTSHFVITPVSVVGSDALGSVTEKIVEKSNTPRNVAMYKGTVAVDEGCEGPASVALVRGVDKPDEVVNIVKQSSRDTASVVCEVSGLVEGGDTPKNNIKMQDQFLFSHYQMSYFVCVM